MSGHPSPDHPAHTHGRCFCGRPLDQAPYARCSWCYTPAPPLPLLPPKPSPIPLMVGCCGEMRVVTHLPFRAPCCNRVFFAQEETP